MVAKGNLFKPFVLIGVCLVDILVACLWICTGFKGGSFRETHLSMRALWLDSQICSHNVSQKFKDIRRFSDHVIWKRPRADISETFFQICGLFRDFLGLCSRRAWETLFQIFGGISGPEGPVARRGVPNATLSVATERLAKKSMSPFDVMLKAST